MKLIHFNTNSFKKDKLDARMRLVYEGVIREIIKKNEQGVMAYIRDNSLVIEHYPDSFFKN